MPYVEGWERRTLDAACLRAGLTPADWEHLGTSRDRASFRSVELGLFAKVTTPGGVERMLVEAAFSVWAAKAGLAILHPTDQVDQPVVWSEGAVTFWPLHRPVSSSDVDMAWLGDTLAQIHALRNQPKLPLWNPEGVFDAHMRRLSSVEQLDRGILEELRDHGSRILRRARALVSSVPAVPLHGDAIPDNVVAGNDRQLLVDCELAQLGPAPFDLAPMLVLARRFGFPATSVSDMLSAYGHTDRVQLDAFAQVIELRTTAGVVGHYASRSPSFRHQLGIRIRSLGDGGRVQWTPHRQLLAELPVAWNGE